MDQSDVQVAKMSGARYIESLLSRSTGRIRSILRLLSMFDVINTRLTNMGDFVMTGTESSRIATRRYLEMIKDYESQRKSIVTNIHMMKDNMASLSGANSEDRSFLDRLKDLEDESGATRDLPAEADALRSLIYLIQVLQGGA